ncbi:MAG: SMI1/KNR4 family protein [Planctomycetes bacterium]|nr:SMI1/KNR4 family protein [Planctomycetota bacterium]
MAAAESRLGVRLPVAYRAWLLRSNGGAVEIAQEIWWLHPVRDDSDERRLGRGWDDVVRQTELALVWPAFPAAAIAIAGNGAGDRLVLMRRAASDDDFGLAIWDHETGVLDWIAEGVEACFAGA